MSPRQRVPLNFGGSLERGFGKMIVRPGSIVDQRNVYLLHGKVLVRRGMEETSVFVDENDIALTDICAIGPQRTERVGLVVGYQGATGKVYIYRVTAIGEDPVRLDVDHRATPDSVTDIRPYWFELDPYGLSEPPIIFMADSFQKLFMAHTSQNINDRAPTVYYDPLSPIPVERLFLELRPGIRPDNPEYAPLPVFFNGVVRHLQYIWGWGYGSSAEPDRPEYLRHCLPGEPLVWDALHYQIAGQRGEPIKNAVSAAKILVSLKDTELYRTFGYDRSTFGIEPLDPNYGIGAPRLATPFKRGVAFWDSSGGPRWTNGQEPSEDLDRDQLELLGLDPADLVEPSDLEEGFACDLITRKVLYFFFGARGYAYHYGSDRSSWSYEERAVPLYCAGELFIGDEEQVGPPTGHPEFIAEDDPYFPWDAGDFSAIPNVRNIDPLGGEILEVWLKLYSDPWPAQPWALYEVDAGLFIQSLNDPPLGESPQEPLEQASLYDIAYRWRRGGAYTEGWEGDTPDDWDPVADVSKGQFTTSGELTVIALMTWDRTGASAEELLGTLFGEPVLTDTTDVQVSLDGETGWSAISGSPFAIGELNFTYDCTGQGEIYLFFRARPTNGGGVWSTVVKKWTGPPSPVGCVGGTIDSSGGNFQCAVPDDDDAGSALFATNIFGYDTDVALVAGPAAQIQPHFSGNPPVLDPTLWDLTAVVSQPARDGIFNQFQYPVTLQIEWESDNGGPNISTVSSDDRTFLATSVTRGDGLVNIRARNRTTVSGTEDFSDYTPLLAIPGSDG